ncbi:MAG: prolyl oligopeptidase family serine peptidase [Chloroflexi bacterium]|nr:prolyl oligopeptidase family serine peptidase [Chloroflexota bacterium]
MKTHYRNVYIMLSLLALLLPYHTVQAQSTTVQAPATPLACEDGAQTSGATYRICMPAQWNGMLIVYAHGYVAPNQPIGIPEAQMKLPGSNISVADTVTERNYAFATSGYSTNGLAVQQGIADLIDVVAIFKTKYPAPQKVLLVGVSEGGLITTIALEQHPDLFNGGLAMCGPYGSFTEQTNYFGDFRVLFDYFFPGLIPGSPVDVPTNLLDTWETSTYSNTILPVITDPANAAKVDQLLAVAYQQNYPANKTQTIGDILWYNIFATNDASTKLGGQPFTNQAHNYTGSADDPTLNQSVARFTANDLALTNMAAGYETTGRLDVPLITMHTTGDPIVPYHQADLYQAKVDAANRGPLYSHIQVQAYGHCQFSSFDILSAFSQLVAKVSNPPLLPRVYLPLVAR